MKHVQASKKVALDSESKVADVSNVKLYIDRKNLGNLDIQSGNLNIQNNWSQSYSCMEYF